MLRWGLSREGGTVPLLQSGQLELIQRIQLEQGLHMMHSSVC